MRSSICVTAVVLASCAACGDDGAGPDAAACVPIEGSYEDWDYDMTFVGVVEATVTDVRDPDVTAVTAPNGRAQLCLDPGATELTMVKTGYLPGRYTIDTAAYLGPFRARGITEARIATIFSDDLGSAETWDAGTAFVEIAVMGFPSGDPVDGVSLEVAGAGEAYHREGIDSWVAGATTNLAGTFVVFPNVPPGDLALTVDAGGRTCRAPATITAVAGEVAMTTVECED